MKTSTPLCFLYVLYRVLQSPTLLVLEGGTVLRVSSAFVIGAQLKPESDPNEQSVALLHATLLALNQSAIVSKPPAVPPAQEDPPGEIVTATGLM